MRSKRLGSESASAYGPEPNAPNDADTTTAFVPLSFHSFSTTIAALKWNTRSTPPSAPTKQLARFAAHAAPHFGAM